MIKNRLIIREFQNSKADLLALYEIMSDLDVNQFLPWFPLKDETEAITFFQSRIQQRYESKQGYYFAVCLKSDDKPIGYITVSGEENHDLGYGLRKEFWGLGIITEATDRVVHFLKEQGWDYITATHDIHNPASGCVMKKIGMIYKYSYKEQWKPKNIPVIFKMYQLNLDGAERTYNDYLNISENQRIVDD